MSGNLLPPRRDREAPALVDRLELMKSGTPPVPQAEQGSEHLERALLQQQRSRLA